MCCWQGGAAAAAHTGSQSQGARQGHPESCCHDTNDLQVPYGANHQGLFLSRLLLETSICHCLNAKLSHAESVTFIGDLQDIQPRWRLHHCMSRYPKQVQNNFLLGVIAGVCHDCRCIIVTCSYSAACLFSCFIKSPKCGKVFHVSPEDKCLDRPKTDKT